MAMTSFSVAFSPLMGGEVLHELVDGRGMGVGFRFAAKKFAKFLAKSCNGSGRCVALLAEQRSRGEGQLTFRFLLEFLEFLEFF